ncbi:MAG: hypothetical protein ACR2NZ_19690 [Rubripirellula sp.]
MNHSMLVGIEEGGPDDKMAEFMRGLLVLAGGMEQRSGVGGGTRWKAAESRGDGRDEAGEELLHETIPL